MATTIKQWHNTDTGAWEPVDSPDWISVAGQLTSGAQVSFLVATVPFNPSGNRFEIYGREGTLTVNARGSNNLGPNVILGSKGKEPLAEMEVPDRFKLVPEGTPQGPPRNVAQAYVRLADAWRSGEPYDPDFDDAVTRHKLIDAIERSAEQGKAVRL
jgi:predicted dehydrogenase